MARDYYEILGVPRGASADEIRKAHRKLARKLHPDVNKETDATKRFAEIQEAYDILSDEQKKAQYDRFGQVGAGTGSAAGGGRGPNVQWRTDVNPADFSSVFEELFNRGGGGGGGPGFGRASGGARKPAARKGEDIESEIAIDFTTAALGGTRAIHLSGAGHPSGAGGSQASIDVRIPPGIDSGGTLRLRGKGAPGHGGGPAGDLLLSITVAPHPWFRRDGLDLSLEVPITIAEAALGATVKLPLLKGSATIKIPGGTSSGRKLRVKGKGIHAADGRQGDFHAVVQIVAPHELGAADEESLRDLGARLENPREKTEWARNMTEHTE